MKQLLSEITTCAEPNRNWPTCACEPRIPQPRSVFGPTLGVVIQVHTPHASSRRNIPPCRLIKLAFRLHTSRSSCHDVSCLVPGDIGGALERQLSPEGSDERSSFLGEYLEVEKRCWISTCWTCVLHGRTYRLQIVE